MKLAPAFQQRMELLLGEDVQDFYACLDDPPPVSIRLNVTKQATSPPDSLAIPWCETGYYLHKRPSFTLDPLFHAGAYYVQEASSMFLEVFF